MKSTLRSLIFLFSLLALINSSSAQECGFEYSKSEIDRILALDTLPKKYLRNAIDQVPVTIHIVRQSNQQGGISFQQVQDALDEANLYFAVIDIEFVACGETNYINEDRFYQLTKNITEQEELYKHNVPNTINIYFTNKVLTSDDNSICGYAHLPQADAAEQKDVVVMANGCVDNGSTFVHELGHYFSLLHTHETYRGSELVDGSNCQTTGDLICDTPADPNLSAKVDTDCDYTGNDRDVQGFSYQPDTRNFMSYSRKSCRSHFTRGQYDRMRKSLDYQRNYLTCQLAPVTCQAPRTADIHIVEQTTSKIQVEYRGQAQQYTWGFRKPGGDWEIFEDTDWTSFWYTGLSPNTSYEFALKIQCTNGKQSDWSMIKTIKTKSAACHRPSVYDIKVIERTTSKIKVQYSGTASRYTWAFRKAGSSQWDIYEDTNWITFWYTGLQSNTTYEIALKVKCSNGVWSEWSKILRVKTQEAHSVCHAPGLSDIILVERTTSKIHVQYRYHASRYTWAFRKKGTSNWEIFENKDWRAFWYTGLQSNTTYEFALKIKCSNGVWSEWSHVFRITTAGYSYDSNNDSNNGIQETNHSFVPNAGIAISIYPNPATEYIQLNGEFTVVQATILNLQGQIVQQFDSIRPHEQVRLDKMSPGSYLLSLEDDRGQSMTKKLIISQ